MQKKKFFRVKGRQKSTVHYTAEENIPKICFFCDFRRTKKKKSVGSEYNFFSFYSKPESTQNYCKNIAFVQNSKLSLTLIRTSKSLENDQLSQKNMSITTFYLPGPVGRREVRETSLFLITANFFALLGEEVSANVWDSEPYFQIDLQTKYETSPISVSLLLQTKFESKFCH